MHLSIIEKIKSYNKSFDEKKLYGVFAFAKKYYQDADGDIKNAFKVLELILPLKPDDETITAVILHDLYLMEFINEETVKNNFGSEVQGLLFSLKKLLDLNYGENDKTSQVEILRRMFLTMARDLRVIIIWLALRVNRLESLGGASSEGGNKLRIAKETMDVYVPIASRLGIYRIKTQLEDLAFQYLHPEEYKVVVKEVDKFGKGKKGIVEQIGNKVQEFFESRGIKAKVTGRFKNVYSIYRKMQKKNWGTLDDIYDIFAIRVVLPVEMDQNGNQLFDHLYMALGLIHSEWKPLSNRFKDYIAVPKPNGYRSLHTVVLGLAPKAFEQPVEIQIRDEQMHAEAEYGVASHWIYKTVGSVDLKKLDSQVEWLKGLAHITEFFASESESDVLRQLDIDIFKDRIFVLTPRGEVKDLPAGSTPLDFAYAVHTDIGNHCVMAKVNASMVSLDHELDNGDVVEIITRADTEPKLKWLSIVKSGFAKNKIKAWFSNLNRENNVKEGRRLMNLQLERLQKPLLDQNYSLLKNFGAVDLSLSQRESLLEEIGKGAKLANDVIKKIYPYEKELSAKKVFYPGGQGQKVTNEKNIILEDQVLIGGEQGLTLRIAACCQPSLRDNIIGYVTRLGRVTIHKAICRLLDNLDGERLIFADWKGKLKNHDGPVYRVGIRLTVISRVGLIHDITSIMTQMGINIVDVLIRKAGSGLYNDCFLLELHDLNQFDVLLDKLENIKGVIKVVKENNFKYNQA